MNPGSAEHKTAFIERLKTDCQENIWKNEITLMRLGDEVAAAKSKLEQHDEAIAKKGKAASNTENKARFNTERAISHLEAEVAKTEEAKRYNQTILDLIPRYESQSNS